MELYKLNMYFLEYYGVINYINSCFTQLKTTRMATNDILDDVVISEDNQNETSNAY